MPYFALQEAVLARDYPVVLATTAVFAALVVMGNALAEANRLGEVGRKDEMKRIFGIEM